MVDPDSVDKNIKFTNQEFEQVAQYLMGSQVRLYPNVIVPQSNGLARVQPKEELMMQNVMESCPFKGIMSFVVGGALGGFLGLFRHVAHVQFDSCLFTFSQKCSWVFPIFEKKIAVCLHFLK